MESRASEDQKTDGGSPQSLLPHSNHSNPYNSLENDRISRKVVGVGVVAVGGKVTVETLDPAPEPTRQPFQARFPAVVGTTKRLPWPMH